VELAAVSAEGQVYYFCQSDEKKSAKRTPSPVRHSLGLLQSIELGLELSQRISSSDPGRETNVIERKSVIGIASA
jgi:hypothetical protein